MSAFQAQITLFHARYTVSMSPREYLSHVPVLAPGDPILNKFIKFYGAN